MKDTHSLTHIVIVTHIPLHRLIQMIEARSSERRIWIITVCSRLVHNVANSFTSSMRTEKSNRERERKRAWSVCVYIYNMRLYNTNNDRLPLFLSLITLSVWLLFFSFCSQLFHRSVSRHIVHKPRCTLRPCSLHGSQAHWSAFSSQLKQKKDKMEIKKSIRNNKRFFFSFFSRFFSPHFLHFLLAISMQWDHWVS